MYRMFTSNRDASPLCRAERKGEGRRDTCETPTGLLERGHTGQCPAPADLATHTWVWWWFSEQKAREGSSPAWQLLLTHLQPSK